eukprot:789115-Rhodomonas_salina.1
MMVKVPSTNPGSYEAGEKTDEARGSSFLSWLGDDAREVDPKELEARLRSVPNVLALEEHIKLAFKSRRDYMLLSNKCLFILDKKGFTGKKLVST